MADIQSATAEIRRGKKRTKKERNHTAKRKELRERLGIDDIILILQ